MNFRLEAVRASLAEQRAAEAAAGARLPGGGQAAGAAQDPGMQDTTVGALADPSSAARRSIEVVWRGALEKKGGLTLYDEGGGVSKNRNYGKGGRRNWQVRDPRCARDRTASTHEQEHLRTPH